MREITKTKQLDELSFDDLYIEEDDMLYPAIRQVLGRLRIRIKTRKDSRVHLVGKETKRFILPIQSMHTNHLKHTGI